jgi:hypothetical protein
MKERKINIFAKVILHTTESDVYVEGVHSFGAWQGEDDEINYDFLYEQTELVADKIHDKLLYSDENLRSVTLDVKKWEIGTDTYIVKNHNKKQLKRTITDSHLRTVKNRKGIMQDVSKINKERVIK